MSSSGRLSSKIMVMKMNILAKTRRVGSRVHYNITISNGQHIKICLMDLLCNGHSRPNKKVPRAPILSDVILIFLLSNMSSPLTYYIGITHHLSVGGKQRKWKKISEFVTSLEEQLKFLRKKQSAAKCFG